MKTKTLIITILLAAVLSGTQGCVVIPTPKVGHHPASRENVNDQTPERIRVGVTTREEILLMLGEADYVSPDEEVLSYGWNKLAAVLFFMVPPYSGGGGPIAGRSRFLIISFDKSGVVQTCQLRDLSPFSSTMARHAALTVASPLDRRLSMVRAINLKVSYFPKAVVVAEAVKFRSGMETALRSSGLAWGTGPNVLTLETTLVRLGTYLDPDTETVEFRVLFRTPDQQVIARMTSELSGKLGQPKKGLGRVFDPFNGNYVQGTHEDLMRALGRRAAEQVMAFMRSDGQTQEPGKQPK